MKTVQQCAVFLFNFRQTNTTQMKYKKLILLLLIPVISMAQKNLNLIPKPQNIEYHSGFFVLNSKTVIQADENSFEAKYLQQIIEQQLGLNLEITTSSKAKSKIVFVTKIIEEKKSFKEWYNLSISKNEVVIKATEDHGIFYGIQTLIQLLPLEKSFEIKIPCLSITDEPKFQWRHAFRRFSSFLSKGFHKKIH